MVVKVFINSTVMENEKENLQNGSAQPSLGASVPKGKPQGEENEVKEGNSSQQRPKYGADSKSNISGREDQLPSLNDGGNPDPSDN